MTTALMEEASPRALARLAKSLDAILHEKSAGYAALAKEIASGRKPIVLHNLEGSALAYAIAALARDANRPVVVFSAGMERAEQLVDDCEFFGAGNVHHYPKWEILPYDDEELSLEVTAKTLDAFQALAAARRGENPGGEPPIVCAPIDAAMIRVLPPGHLEELSTRIRWGDSIDLASLAERLSAAGYERVGIVESRGEFSIRGSIVDIYPPNADDPVRLDLFGDEVEAIRKFDPATQRSTADLGTEAVVEVSGSQLKGQFDARLEAGKPLACFFDHLPDDALVILDNPERYEEVLQYYESAVERQFNEVLHGDSRLGPPSNLILSQDELRARLGRFRRIEHTRLPADGDASKIAEIAFDTAGFSAPGGDLAAWIGAIKRLQHEDHLVAIVCDNSGQVQRFQEILHENAISSRPLVSEADAESYQPRSALAGYRDVLLVVGGMHDSFRFTDARVALVTDRDIFGRYKRRHAYRKIYKGRPIASSNDIQRGDFVVHVDHGVSIYRGMRQQQIDGRIVDLLELEYGGGDKLLVPVEKIRAVQKHAGAETENIVLDRLGSNRWAKRKAKSSAEVEKLAEMLLELYAKREAARREPFKADTLWQREFESSFPYQETSDQLKAIGEVKFDMERHRPMDRLLCGDVGYGKTEVAIRGVFKCVQEGRQAAVLVPTTVLALQHFKTFKERFADYPVKVELMSRFQKAADIKAIKARAKSGEAQVVVGTHKLLGKDMEFADLGLLVIDEEQRFGVKHKERLKELRAEVDILTMTATPIPRTLHMALAGLRDLSVITTPPPDRHPIRTRIIHWEEEQIAEAILRELNRGGQVFFIHNRVHNIQEIATRLQRIVPHARIGIAHGQMKETELEDHMVQFIDGGYDILVSTTIVESGIDIPNANTIIVNRADAFGLAQLYQLRGRVGREKRRAYAYLIVPQGQAITDTAVKRLAAIEEFTELGAGFNIAMRDMEIRGAGNLLGKEQHGLVNEVGFELYCDMLQEAVARVRGGEVRAHHDIEVRWPASSYIPAPYVPVETQRVNFYKRLAMMRELVDIEDLAAELRDRYGEPPGPVLLLLAIARLRVAASPLRLSVVDGGPRTAARLTTIGREADQWRPLLRDQSLLVDGLSNARVESASTILVDVAADEDEAARVTRLADYMANLAGAFDRAKAQPAGAPG